jgi:hypothetical protein
MSNCSCPLYSICCKKLEKGESHPVDSCNENTSNGMCFFCKLNEDNQRQYWSEDYYKDVKTI